MTPLRTDFSFYVSLDSGQLRELSVSYLDDIKLSGDTLLRNRFHMKYQRFNIVEDYLLP